MGEIIPIIDELNVIDKREVDIEELVNSLKKDMDEELENAIQNVDLEGDEILNLLNKNLPPKINKIFDEIINERKKIIREKTGFDLNSYLENTLLKLTTVKSKEFNWNSPPKKKMIFLMLRKVQLSN